MRDVRLTPNLPDGWTSTATSTFAAVDPGKTVSTKLQVTPGASVQPASFTLRLDATYKVHDTSYTNSTVATTQLPYASLSQAANVISVSNASTYAQGNFDGSGNSFNGEAAGGVREGPVHPVRPGQHHDGLPGLLHRRTAHSGQVDGVVKYTSDLLTGTSPTVPVAVDVTGGQTLTLQVTDGGDGVTSDHADWAEAQLTCRTG